MQLALAGGIVFALVLLYYTAKRNGKLEEQKRAQSLQIQAQAADFRTLEAQLSRWEEWREKIDTRLKGIDVRILPDSQLQSLYKNAAIVVEVTDPYSVKLEESKSAK
jgi:hypothetical protein